MRKLFFQVAICIISLFTACAQSKKAGNKNTGTTYAKLYRHISQDQPDTQPVFLIIWTSNQIPETFYWRGSDGWMDCTVKRAYTTGREETQDSPKWYSVATIKLNAIKKGDTLEITPVAGGKNPTPASIPANAQNRIYFKTASSGWLYLSAIKEL